MGIIAKMIIISIMGMRKVRMGSMSMLMGGRSFMRIIGLLLGLILGGISMGGRFRIVIIRMSSVD